MSCALINLSLLFALINLVKEQKYPSCINSDQNKKEERCRYGYASPRFILFRKAQKINQTPKKKRNRILTSLKRSLNDVHKRANLNFKCCISHMKNESHIIKTEITDSKAGPEFFGCHINLTHNQDILTKTPWISRTPLVCQCAERSSHIQVLAN